LNITISGERNLRFKICAAIAKHCDIVNCADSNNHSSASITDFFHSFESHRRPVLLSIAALHSIKVPGNAMIDFLRTQITQHLLSGQCSQLSQTHPSTSLPNGLSLLDCADVHNEWLGNALDAELQVHILTAMYGSKISLNPLCRVLDNLNVMHENADSIRQLHRRLKHYITKLWRGKKVEQSEKLQRIARAKHDAKLTEIRRIWPQLVPQSVKNKRLRMFRAQTSSEALSTFP
jgi:hypothetical protein